MKKSRNKVLALALIACMVTSFTACSGNNTETQASKSDTQVANSDTTTETPITLTCAITMSEDSVYYSDLTKLQEELNKSSDSITLDIQAGGVLGGETEYIEGLQAGTIDVMIVSFSPLSATSPKCGMFEIPYLIDDFDHLNRVWESSIGDEIRTDLSNIGIRALGVMDFGYREMTNNTRPITTPEDLKGIILRVMQSDIQIRSWETLGATPVTMAVTEVFSALQTGTIQGQENPINAICSNGFHEVQKYLSMTNHLYAPVMLAISESAWNRMSETQRNALLEAASATAENSPAVCEKYTESGMQTILDAGVEVNEVDREAFEAAIQPLHDELNEQYDGAVDIIKSMK